MYFPLNCVSFSFFFPLAPLPCLFSLIFGCGFCIFLELCPTYLVCHWTCSWQKSLPVSNASCRSWILSLSILSGFSSGWVRAVCSEVSTYNTVLQGAKFPLNDIREKSRLKYVTAHSFSSEKNSEYLIHTPSFPRYAIFFTSKYSRILTCSFCGLKNQTKSVPGWIGSGGCYTICLRKTYYLILLPSDSPLKVD